jgi:aspartyl-tRNA(Asn)/glutamyl-tRNA(Gln) amidotransferase subunit A
LAGSKALDDSPPAQSDAPIVARLRAAGAVLIGRTNMTEFAFSRRHQSALRHPW